MSWDKVYYSNAYKNGMYWKKKCWRDYAEKSDIFGQSYADNQVEQFNFDMLYGEWLAMHMFGYLHTVLGCFDTFNLTDDYVEYDVIRKYKRLFYDSVKESKEKKQK